MSVPLTNTHPRLVREARTIESMIQIYCRRKCRRHTADATGKCLCADCQELYDYAVVRLNKCPFQEEKSTCANCKVHCYKPDMRARIRDVMRYAGPFMLYRHPYLTFMHLVVDDRREAKELPVHGRVRE